MIFLNKAIVAEDFKVFIVSADGNFYYWKQFLWNSLKLESSVCWHDYQSLMHHTNEIIFYQQPICGFSPKSEVIPDMWPGTRRCQEEKRIFHISHCTWPHSFFSFWLIPLSYFSNSVTMSRIIFWNASARYWTHFWVHHNFNVFSNSPFLIFGSMFDPQRYWIHKHVEDNLLCRVSH